MPLQRSSKVGELCVCNTAWTIFVALLFLYIYFLLLFLSSKSAALYPNSGHVHLLTAFLKQIACKAADRRPEVPVLHL